MEMTLDVSGPVFDGRAVQQCHLIVSEAVTRVGLFALERVQFNLDASIRNPTPYYETQIVVQHRGVTELAVTDRGVIYGAWLEGVGSRNQTSRFKGYASFRKALQTTQAEVPRLVQEIVDDHLRSMGG